MSQENDLPHSKTKLTQKVTLLMTFIHVTKLSRHCRVVIGVMVGSRKGLIGDFFQDHTCFRVEFLGISLFKIYNP